MASFSFIFVSVSGNSYTIKIVHFSEIQTRIVGNEGECAYHFTTPRPGIGCSFKKIFDLGYSIHTSADFDMF